MPKLRPLRAQAPADNHGFPLPLARGAAPVPHPPGRRHLTLALPLPMEKKSQETVATMTVEVMGTGWEVVSRKTRTTDTEM